MFTHPQFSKNNLKRQLEREYGVDVDKVDVDGAPPTDEEVGWVEKLLLAPVSGYAQSKVPTPEEVETAKKAMKSKCTWTSLQFSLW